MPACSPRCGTAQKVCGQHWAAEGQVASGGAHGSSCQQRKSCSLFPLEKQYCVGVNQTRPYCVDQGFSTLALVTHRGLDNSVLCLVGGLFWSL